MVAPERSRAKSLGASVGANPGGGDSRNEAAACSCAASSASTSARMAALSPQARSRKAWRLSGAAIAKASAKMVFSSLTGPVLNLSKGLVRLSDPPVQPGTGEGPVAGGGGGGDVHRVRRLIAAQP